MDIRYYGRTEGKDGYCRDVPLSKIDAKRYLKSEREGGKERKVDEGERDLYLIRLNRVPFKIVPRIPAVLFPI